MGKYWPVAVEVIAFLTFFATTLLEIITQKHIYNTSAKDHVNTNKLNFCKTSKNTNCCNSTDVGINMQDSADTEYWLLYINLASLLMAMLSTVLLGIWSETDGRKVVLIVSLLGTVVRVALFIIIDPSVPGAIPLFCNCKSNDKYTGIQHQPYGIIHGLYC